MQALPEDLKTKLSIDDELVSSPKEAFSRVSADRRNKLMKRFHSNILVSSLNCWNFGTWMKLADFLIMLSSGLSQSYSTHGDKNIVKLSKLTETNRRFGGGRALEPPAINQVTFVKNYNYHDSWKPLRKHMWSLMQMFLFPLLFHRVQSPSFQNRYQHWMKGWMSLPLELKNSTRNLQWKNICPVSRT
jgi:hypothetical protein